MVATATSIRPLRPHRPAAVAAAFVAGGTLEAPVVGPMLLAATSVVGFARRRPIRRSDAGALAAGAAAAVALSRVWRVPPADGADAARSPRRSPRHLGADGSSLTVVVNPGAGRDDVDLSDRITDVLPAARLVHVEDDLMERLEEAAAAGVMGVVGGDGTINAAAGVAIEHDRPLAVFAGGTLNHFARDAGIETVERSASAIAAGDIARIDVGRIDGEPFLNTASLGSYAELVDERERLEPKLGKWAAMAVASARILRHGSPTSLRIDGEPIDVWLIFIGNCEYSPPGLAPGFRRTLDDGMFDVRLVDGGQRWSRARLVAAMLTGQVGRTKVYRRTLTDRLVITADQPLRLARDGETFDGGREVVIEKDPVGLDVFVPID